MQRALELAARVPPASVSPNPRVGCVLVKAGRIVGEGQHEWCGGPHAEVVALNQAGAAAAGSTAYVTQEPCCHQGRTGPCTTALIDAGVSRVVAAMGDPNPLVAGQGFSLLEQAGIDVEVGSCAEQAAGLNPGYLSRMTLGRPRVRVKIAM
ncbi:MAG: bifunctional diaminohydroxyphosphoribosylaminopyrimidine deaminase/5-amino-6-(5-phosphoribosylamino)uracil reductase RibD, partial [Gammaproteobacteria bacterium]|nr:bifunctional diaminohydroxyphosphoribosylaminopyrimidine deaminase/5-amino-6-(5-phosphoribosylamino)uracil reductase RibD [Gammaproteobacteria bacterium]